MQPYNFGRRIKKIAKLHWKYLYYDAFEIRLPRILHLSVFYIQNEAKSRSIWLHLVLTLSSDKMRTIFRAKFNCKNALLSYVFMWFLFAIYKMIGERLAKNIIKASCITYINIQNKTQQLKLPKVPPKWQPKVCSKGPKKVSKWPK